MAIEIVASRTATRAEWSQAFDACERATFFHGPLWSEIWEAYTEGRYRPTPRILEFSDGRTALLGATTEQVGFGIERQHLSPGGNYGGWLASEPLPLEHARALAAEILQARGLVWRLSPFEHDDGLTVPNVRNEVTHVIDLRQGADAARARWKGSARREVGRAERSGVRCRSATTAQDWLAYDALYRMSIERWGTASSLYQRSLFTLFHEVGPPSIRLLLAEANGRMVAGVVMFFAHRRAVYWHGASAGRDAPGASNLLQWQALEILEAEGIETYDLNPSGGHSGVVWFKESLGAAAKPAPIVIQPHRFETVARRAERWRTRLVRRQRAGRPGLA